jgi:hypothetical protein
MLRRNVIYGQLLMATGQASRGIALLEKARSEDPLNATAAINLLIAYEVGRQFDRADVLSREIRSLPSFAPGVIEGTDVVRAMGRGDRAEVRRTLDLVVEADPFSGVINAAMRGYLDDSGGGRRELARLLADPQLNAGIFPLIPISHWASYLGDDRLALQALERAARLEVPLYQWGVTLWRPVTASLRGDPAFKRVLHQVGLVDYWKSSGNWGEFCAPTGPDDFECH